MNECRVGITLKSMVHNHKQRDRHEGQGQKDSIQRYRNGKKDQYRNITYKAAAQEGHASYPAITSLMVAYTLIYSE